MRLKTISGRSLDDLLAESRKTRPRVEEKSVAVSEPFNLGDVLSAEPHSLSAKGNPIVKIRHDNGQTYSVEVYESIDQRFGAESNIARKHLLEVIRKGNENGNDETPFKIKIFGLPEHWGTYRAVCYTERKTFTKPEAKLPDLSMADAHSVVFSDRVFYGLVTKNAVEMTHDKYLDFDYEHRVTRVFGYNRSGEKLVGFLNTVSDRNRPRWESWRYPHDLFHAEMLISTDIIRGSKRFCTEGLTEGQRVLIRKIADNSHLCGRNSVTHFFEPVVTLRESDEATDIYKNDHMITGVFDADGVHKKEGYARGDTIRYLPIVRTFETNNMGIVGVGYVLRGTDNFNGLGFWDKRPSYMQQVLVKDAAKDLGTVVSDARILSIKNAIIAER
jgi:hypothetical protein